MSNFENERAPWKPDRLAYWYFRLNGFLTIENFYVHSDTGAKARTDADILAVRFEHRAENRVNEMEDDPLICSCSTFANVIIAEVKKDMCRLNGPWTDRSKGNMQRVLTALGCVEKGQEDGVAELLYDKKPWSDGELVTVRLFALGDRKNRELDKTEVVQVIWDSTIDFFLKRFNEYKLEKSDTLHWTSDGMRLRELSLAKRRDLIRSEFGLPMR